MARRKTPPKEHHFETGCALMLLIYCLIVVLVAIAFGWRWWALLALLAPGLVLVHVLYGFFLRICVTLKWSRTRVRGVLVYSDSPKWKEYIEREWMPRLEDRVVVLNWSNHNTWPRSLAVLFFRHYLLGRGVKPAYCPALILFRGLRYPYLYQFYFAFLDAKHGKSQQLKRLETEMYEDFGVVTI